LTDAETENTASAETPSVDPEAQQVIDVTEDDAKQEPESIAQEADDTDASPVLPESAVDDTVPPGASPEEAEKLATEAQPPMEEEGDPGSVPNEETKAEADPEMKSDTGIEEPKDDQPTVETKDDAPVEDVKVEPNSGDVKEEVTEEGKAEGKEEGKEDVKEEGKEENTEEVSDSTFQPGVGQEKRLSVAGGIEYDFLAQEFSGNTAKKARCHD